MTTGRRVVAAVAAAAALAAVASNVASWWAVQSQIGGSGWFTYSPGSDDPPSIDLSAPFWRSAVVWLVAVAIWTAFAWWLFRPLPSGPVADAPIAGAWAWSYGTEGVAPAPTPEDVTAEALAVERRWGPTTTGDVHNRSRPGPTR